jgi:hypothetical protein
MLPIQGTDGSYSSAAFLHAKLNYSGPKAKNLNEV